MLSQLGKDSKKHSNSIVEKTLIIILESGILFIFYLVRLQLHFLTGKLRELFVTDYRNAERIEGFGYPGT